MEDSNILNKLRKTFPYLAIILLAVFARIIPHPPNFAPIGGLAIFSGNHFKKKIAIFIPLLSMVISDYFLGFHETIIFVYVSFFIMFLIGRKVKNNISSLLLASLISSILFFLITNFGVWVTGSMYPKTIYGLMQSYLMGLPFFRNTVLSDLIYTFSFFYGFRYLNSFLHKKLFT